MSTRNLRSRRRKFISAGVPGVCVLRHHPILRPAVHRCQRVLILRIWFVSRRINGLRNENKTSMERTMQRFECLRNLHVALVGKFIDRGQTRILSNFEHVVVVGVPVPVPR
jgi:hypothetical protein